MHAPYGQQVRPHGGVKRFSVAVGLLDQLAVGLAADHIAGSRHYLHRDLLHPAGPHIYAWQDEHPELNLFLDGSHAEPSPEGYDIDFRFTYGDYVATENAIELFRDCVVPVCSPWLLRPDVLLNKPADLLAYPLLSIDWLPKFASPPSWRDWFKAQQVDCESIRDGYRVYSLSAMAIQAALAGQGVVLAQYSMVADALSDGRLIRPFARALPLPSAYFLVGAKGAFDKAHCRDFHRWIVARGREQMVINQRLLA